MARPVVKNGLVAFDFDQTIIDANSDVAVVDMIDDGQVPEAAKRLYAEEDNWTDYMQAIFRHLHASGTKKRQYDDVLDSLRFVEGVPALLKWLAGNDFEVIIISDSNAYFIDHVLGTRSLHQFVTKVFTNPAHFDDNGLLHIQWYHVQDHCLLSNKNMCKGQILEDYIEKRNSQNVTFRRHYYCGDGTNDFCPSLRLKEGDVALPRIGYRLESKLKDCDTLKAEVFPWSHGDEILDHLKSHEFMNLKCP